jgi:hypothetical protein
MNPSFEGMEATACRAQSQHFNTAWTPAQPGGEAGDWLLRENPHFYDLAGPDGLECDERIRDMRPNVIEIVGGCPDDEHSEIVPRDVLLILDIFVYGDEDIEYVVSQSEKLAVFFAIESCVSHRFTLMPARGEQGFHFSGQALVNEQSHFRVAAKLILASSRAEIASVRVTLGKSSRNSLRLRPCSR